MRDYAVVKPQFWTGETGRLIRSMGRDAQVVAIYLMTSPGANMIGLYYLPMPTLCHETGVPLEGACKALRSLSEGGFCAYDEAEEVIWVPEMARYQIGESLSPNDNRVKGIVREIENYRKSRFFNDFVSRYRDAYHLPNIKPLPSPLQGASKPLRSQDQDQDQEQEQDIPVAAQPGPAAPNPASGKKAKKKPTQASGPHQELIAHFTDGWRERFGNNYDFKDGKDGMAAKRILKACGDDLDRATRIISAYLDDDDQFISKKGHTLAMLSSEINGYLARGVNGSGNGEYLAPPREPDEADLALIRAGGDA